MFSSLKEKKKKCRKYWENKKIDCKNESEQNEKKKRKMWLEFIDNKKQEKRNNDQNFLL